jgi:uncharacterized protein YecE (DUF72 family)
MSETQPDKIAEDDSPCVVRIGCAGLPNSVSRQQYFERLDMLEADVTFIEPPRDLALRKWHQDAPQGAAFTMLAWQFITHEASTPGYERLAQPLAKELQLQVGNFRATPAVKDAWQRTLAAAHTLSAEVVLFQSPPSFTPSLANQDAMRRFFGEIVGERPKDLVLAWEPRGMWEPNQAAKLAGELGLVYATDPLQLEVEPPEGPDAYFRLYGLGLHRNKIGDDAMDLIADMLDLYERAWIVFNNVEKYHDATRFKKLIAGREFVGDDAE